MKVIFDTFGCRLNRAEALQMEADYLANGWEIARFHREADLFVVRGCSVTAHAQHECESVISHLRRTYPGVPLHVCGCLRDPQNAAPAKPATDNGAAKLLATPTDAVPTRSARAFLKVQDGCTGGCTFCVVPSFRGDSASVGWTEALDKAKRFLDAGYREIVVTGCNLSLYESQGKQLPDLVAALAALSPDCRIRLGSIEPAACARDILQAMAAHENVCRSLHIPVQSASAHILKSMNRPYSPEDLDALVGTAAQLMPSIGLGCDLIVGFPGEDAGDFFATRQFLARHPFSRAHVFPFSKRPGTPAATLPNQIERSVRHARARELTTLMNAKRAKFAATFIGKTVEIVVEHRQKCSGWTNEYLKCEAVGTAERKSRVRIRVEREEDGRLFGRLIDAQSAAVTRI